MNSTLDITLQDTLQDLEQQNLSFDEFTERLFSFSYEDYRDHFQIETISIPENSYLRIPVFRGNFVAFLMLWGKNNVTAIHDHKNYEGMIKVLHGSLCEVSYREREDFICYDSECTVHQGAVFSEDFWGIHSIVNRSKGISVSLHVYNTPQTDLKGVRLFDLAKKKLAILSDKATSCSWNLPKEAYQFVLSF